jgi:oxepin-CoA hydrolase/3-oxo-5,6-dehydrosuberyl-CoA semialdehyde dehydrogenase
MTLSLQPSPNCFRALLNPAKEPVLANYGQEGARFVKPLKPGNPRAMPAVKSKTRRAGEQGEICWA